LATLSQRWCRAFEQVKSSWSLVGEGVNKVATPSLASEIGSTIHRIIERDASGCFHVVADDAITREDLAALACEVFDLDPTLVTSGEPPGGRSL
jgi:dTDP-4-dehydrorhamnose reductase